MMFPFPILRILFTLIILMYSINVFGQKMNIAGTWEIKANCTNDTFLLMCDTVCLEKRFYNFYHGDTLQEIYFDSINYTFRYDLCFHKTLHEDSLDFIHSQKEVFNIVVNTFSDQRSISQFNKFEYLLNCDTLILQFRNEPYPLTWSGYRNKTNKEIHNHYSKAGNYLMIRYSVRFDENDNVELIRVRDSFNDDNVANEN